jgi:hypothetical protein
MSIDECRGGSKIVEKNRSRKGIENSRMRSVEYSTIGYKVIVALIIIVKMSKRECV